MRATAVLLAAALPALTRAACPFAGEASGAALPQGHPTVPRRRSNAYAAAVAQLDLDAVKADLKALFVSSQDLWPADGNHYGPLFVRLAWHCAGSYRTSDGRGGCEGGRQRFEPERSWADNTNLDKARALLVPIKVKYGLGLSWGDLIILAGTTAIEAMGGPVLGFCAGRVDDDSGAESEPLGPSPVQEELYPCPVNGTCEMPLGSTTVGLIYLNPEGPMGQPIPEGSAKNIRDAFGRMAMNDSETVALIGGGHAFGKAHGACPDGPGPAPREDPLNPWPGKCGSGKGGDAFTSGFELQWTANPATWDNDYFKALANNEWEKHQGPGGHWQWRIKNATGEAAKLGMLTSDVSLTYDPEYKKLVQAWSEDQASFDDAFAHVWYKLVTRDMGPVTRCVGKDVPPPQPFQYPLPPPAAVLADFDKVKADITQVLRTSAEVLPADQYDGEPYYGALFVRLAWRCASTFRETDWLGGCNGARLRFAPEKKWPANADLDRTLQVLKPIKDKFGDGLSWADLIVLAGNAAIEDAGGRPLHFCGGRSDAVDGAGSEFLSPTVESPRDADAFKNAMRVMGLTVQDAAVLIGGGHSLGKMHASRSGFEGSWTANPTKLDNSYFKNLVLEQWEEHEVAGTGKKQYKAKGKELYMLTSDVLMRADPEYSVVVQDYASDNDRFLDDFAAAWTRLMNADRFDGPAGNVCDKSVAHDSSSAPELLV
mmetsp:Transcript_66568/g.192200  ORF Transcript_66568/g.192200 Transcript_66568/m.192200 type:complete len:711 (-) Transcript_66568:158-2290(-)